MLSPTKKNLSFNLSSLAEKFLYLSALNIDMIEDAECKSVE